MELDYYVHAVTTNVDVGNSVAALVASLPGDSTAFSRGLPCYPAGTTFSRVPDGPVWKYVPSAAPTAWAVGVHATQGTHAVAAEFSGPAPYPLIAARGMSEGQVLSAKNYVSVQTGLRSEAEPSLREFVQSLGYVLP